jgi:predicted nucleic acid-binding protein
MMKMVARAFVDTNILLRAFHNNFSEHKRVRDLFDFMLEQDYELWISRQIIREYLVQVTSPRTFLEPLSIDTVLNQLETIQTICRVADETGPVTTKLLELLKTYPTRGKQIHDANIVATMLAYNIETLLTLNIDDLKRFGSIIKLITVGEIP